MSHHPIQEVSSRSSGHNGASEWICLKSYIMWALVTIIAPEIVLCKAIMDWGQALQQWRGLKKETREQWTLTHMLYADMGGFFYCADPAHTEAIKTSYGMEMEGFVVGAKVLRQADQDGILPLKPPVTKAEILDKSKSNWFDKIVTMGQLLYFCISIIARVTEDLTITQLELTVCGFAVCSISTYVFTFLKPKGVNTRTVWRHGDVKTFDRFLMIAAGTPDDPSDLQVAAHVDSGAATTCTVRLSDSRILTPVPTGNDLSRHDLEAQRKLEADEKKRRKASAEARRALQRTKNNPFSGDFNAAWFLMPLVSIPVGAIHVAGWNLHFPTVAELWLWRSAAIVSTAVLPLGLLLGFLLFLLDILLEDKLGGHSDPVSTVSAVMLIVVMAAYIVSRMILIVGMIRCLFFLPPDAFLATWAANIPHIG
ncbi:hypothetical protein LTR53_002861 [Teratosphaeriaceae sp. CCFEE 6253]|nr:hypothetical protein LTR53_002861 [Teratosphaeriaceae sp. CCFEE 6253]